MLTQGGPNCVSKLRENQEVPALETERPADRLSAHACVGDVPARRSCDLKGNDLHETPCALEKRGFKWRNNGRFYNNLTLHISASFEAEASKAPENKIGFKNVLVEALLPLVRSVSLRGQRPLLGRRRTNR